MADNYLITGYWGEPHVTAENDRGINAGLLGAGKYVLPVGEQFRAEYIGNNTIRMYDGKLIDNGAAAGIPAGEYVDLLISNAGQGMKRIDLIIFRYRKSSNTFIEYGDFIVLQGTESSGTPTSPTLKNADLLSGNAVLDHMALWSVSISGATISSPKKMFNVSLSINSLKEYANMIAQQQAEDYFSDSLPLAGGRMTGAISMNNNAIVDLAAPKNAGDAVNKNYADTKLSKEGGVMIGEIDMGGKKIMNLSNPVNNGDAVNKTYADTKLPKSGGVMTGDLDVGGNWVKNLSIPKNDTDAVNLGLAKSMGNPYNFLDNGDFNQIVDQRGAGTYTGAGYGFDRWVSLDSQLTAKKIVYTHPTTNTKEGLLQLKNANTSGVVAYGQRLSPELSDWMRGKRFTFAICKLDGTIISCSGTCSADDLTDPATQIQFYATGTDDVYRIEVIKVSTTQCFTARIWVKEGGTVALRWAALYQGEFATHTLPAYHPKGYATELLECQRYYQKLYNSVKTGFVTTNSTMLRLGITLPVPLRISSPTLNVIQANGLRTVNGSNISIKDTNADLITSTTITAYADGSANIDIYTSAVSGATNNTPVALYFSAELSAEL